MKKLLVIIPKRKIRRILPAVLVMIVIIACILVMKRNSTPLIQAYFSFDESEEAALVKENARLKNILASFLPHEDKMIYEDPLRSNIESVPSVSQTYPLQEVLIKGKEIQFHRLFDDPYYQRPLYTSDWKDAYFRGWSYLPSRLTDARHRLFVFPIGLSALFDMTGELGFDLDESTNIDAHRNINFLVYKFNVEKIRLLKDQMVFIGTPERTGVQIISVKVKDALPKDIDHKNFLFQLSTPGGYEADYLYAGYGRTEYLKKLEQEENAQQTYEQDTSPGNLEQLQKENQRLEEELSRFVPLGTGTLSEKVYCSIDSVSNKPADIDAVLKKGRNICIQLNYYNKTYKKPIYHPQWKQHYLEGWSYIPDKVDENMHRVFTIPNDPEKRSILLGKLAFNEKYLPIQPGKQGILVYGHTITRIVAYNGRLILVGQPIRNGAQLLTINQNMLTAGKNYTIQLITPDHHEVDCVPFAGS